MLSGIEPPVLDARQLSIYTPLKNVIENKEFMSEGGKYPEYFFNQHRPSDELAYTLSTGGYLGFYCSHAYAHTNTDAVVLPDMLKGLDMVIWETFGRLGLEASVKPVLSLENFYEDEDPMILGNDRALHMSTLMRIEDYDEMDEQIRQWRGGETLDFKEVHWLTKPNHKQLQLAYIAVSTRLNLRVSPQNELKTNLTFTQSMATRRAWLLSIRTVRSLLGCSPVMPDRIENPLVGRGPVTVAFTNIAVSTGLRLDAADTLRHI